MKLDSSVSTLPGIGTSFAGKLGKLGITSVFDLLYHLPFRFEDRSLISPVSVVQPGETITVAGTVTSIKNEFTHTGKFVQKAVITDHSGSLDVIWFNQMFLVKALKGKSVALYGKVDFFGRQKALISPEYEIITNYPPPKLGGGFKEGGIEKKYDNSLGGVDLVHMARIVPVYPETAGVSSKWLRSKIFSLLKILSDNDPWPSFDLPGWKKSLLESHFPSTFNFQLSTLNYRNRLAFDELFLLQLKSQVYKQTWKKTHLSHPFSIPQTRVLEFISRLPFTLTVSQNQSIKEILSDLSDPAPMNRLLEGDVGSGKTVVAAVAAYVAFLNGFQTVILAPTQILATQHYQTLSALFKPYGLDIGLVIAGSKLKIENLKFKILVGTHALLSDKRSEIFREVGLVVIDEQHRFGVTQRALAAKLGSSPHILTMTATPIPRSVALTMFGDLDLSLLSEKPSDRLPVKTWLVPEIKRLPAYDWIKTQIASSRSQVFIVCPFIHDSETQATIKAATTEFSNLMQIFPNFKLGLLHGQLKSAQKDQIINSFRAGEIDILVATPVVEVGLDIPNASVMVIEGAEKFGLAQLHQLRGRVGRSSNQSYCLLFSSDNSESARLKSLETLDSGSELAELDLKYRGPGEIYGTAQHGFPQFKVATYDNLGLIEKAKEAAGQVLPVIDKYPTLKDLIKNDKITLIQPN